MKDRTFILRILQEGQRAKEKVVSEFSSLSEEQFNWKPSPKSWSIAECLEHLIISNSAYFHTFGTIVSGHYVMSFKERFSPLTWLWGKVMKDAMKEEPSRKMTTHKTLNPVTSHFKLDHVQRYLMSCDTLLNYVSGCQQVDLDKTVITSPALKFVTYNLRDAFTFLATHQHRHINQGVRVKEMKRFGFTLPVL